MRNTNTKEQMRLSGVYCIINTVTGKRYVGSAGRSFNQRFLNHRKALRNGNHHSSLLQHAWNKYGPDAFQFQIVEVTLPEHAVAQEQVFINYWKTSDREYGYNIVPVAGSWLGMKHTDQSRAKNSAAHRGKRLSADTRNKLSAIGKGRPKSDEHRAKIAAANKGKVVTNETRAKMSKAWKSRVVSQETRLKLSLSGKGRIHSAETKAKIAAANKGKVVSDTTRAKMSAARKARVCR